MSVTIQNVIPLLSMLVKKFSHVLIIVEELKMKINAFLVFIANHQVFFVHYGDFKRRFLEKSKVPGDKV